MTTCRKNGRLRRPGRRRPVMPLTSNTASTKAFASTEHSMLSMDQVREWALSQWKSLLALSCFTLVILTRGTVVQVILHPPGPRPNSLLGNKIPNERQWLQFDAWRKKYGELVIELCLTSSFMASSPKGDIVRVTTLGQPILILGSQKTASDLLDIRGRL